MKDVSALLLLFGWFYFTSSVFSQAKQQQAAPKSNIEIKTFKADYGWGYDILIDGKKYIHQEHIPSVPGNEGFANEQDAKKTAGLMADKISKNIMPPSVTPQELDSMKVAWRKMK